MELKEFIKQTLVQIIEGVNDTNDAVRRSGAYVRTTQGYCIGGGPIHSTALATNVDFDVAVVTTETNATNGGGGIKVASVFSAGGNIEDKTENQITSRVKFTLQLRLSDKK